MWKKSEKSFFFYVQISFLLALLIFRDVLLCFLTVKNILDRSPSFFMLLLVPEREIIFVLPVSLFLSPLRCLRSCVTVTQHVLFDFCYLVDSTLTKLVRSYITCGLLITSYGKNNELFGKKISIKLGNTEYFTNFNNLNNSLFNKIANKSLYYYYTRKMAI